MRSGTLYLSGSTLINFERVSGELIDGLVDSALGKGGLDLKVLVQLDGEPLNRTASELIHILNEPVEMSLLDPTATVATPRQLVYATGMKEGDDNASDSRRGDVEVASYKCHGHALISD
jgi:hypothetical protein